MRDTVCFSEILASTNKSTWYQNPDNGGGGGGSGALSGFPKSSILLYWKFTKKDWTSRQKFTEECDDQLHNELNIFCKAENTEEPCLCWIMLLDILL
jgi:hypothetical protein